MISLSKKIIIFKKMLLNNPQLTEEDFNNISLNIQGLIIQCFVNSVNEESKKSYDDLLIQVKKTTDQRDLWVLCHEFEKIYTIDNSFFGVPINDFCLKIIGINKKESYVYLIPSSPYSPENIPTVVLNVDDKGLSDESYLIYQIIKIPLNDISKIPRGNITGSLINEHHVKLGIILQKIEETDGFVTLHNRFNRRVDINNKKEVNEMTYQPNQIKEILESCKFNTDDLTGDYVIYISDLLDN
jgi:hypothetical protein